MPPHRDIDIGEPKIDRLTVGDVSAAGVIGAYDVELLDATSAGFTRTLPPASPNSGRSFTFKKVNATNTVVIDAYSSETINGLASIDLTEQYEVLQLISNGTSWDII